MDSFWILLSSGIFLLSWFELSSAASLLGKVIVSHSEIQLTRNATCNFDQCKVICYVFGFIGSPGLKWAIGKNQVRKSPTVDGVYQVFNFTKSLNHTTTLMLSKARYSDSKQYKCVGLFDDAVSHVEEVLHTYVNITGPPEQNYALSSTSVSSNNTVRFTCAFDGNPRPSVEWRFSNGSKLPATSQFQVGTLTQPSQFQSSLDLTVYRTDCQNVSSLQFRCFARNFYSSSIKSHVFQSLSTGPAVHSVPQVAFNFTADECNGTTANISWNFVPGAQFLSHKLFVGSSAVLSAPGQSSAKFTDLKPRLDYNVTVMPLFQGCSEMPLPRSRLMTAGPAPLRSPGNVTLTKRNDACVVTWTVQNAHNEYDGISVKYMEMANENRGSMTNAKSNRTNLNKSVRQHTITASAPNTRYEVYVGLRPPKPCQGKVNIEWSKNFTGNCITEAKGPTSVPLSNKPPVSVTGGVKVSLEPVSERNGLISCYFVIAHKVLNGGNGKVESNITKLRQVNVSAGVKDGDSYIAIAIPRIAQAKDVTIGDSTKSCCDVTDTSGMSRCSVTSSRKRRSVSGSVVQGRNWPLTAGANYTYYIITATPVQTGSAPHVVIYTASPSHLFAVKEVIGPPTGPADPSSGPVALYVIIVIVILAVIGVVVFLLYRRRQQNHHKTTKNESNDEEVELRSPTSDNSDHVIAKTESERLKHTEAISA